MNQTDTQDEYPKDTYHISPIQRIVRAEIEIKSLLATTVLFGGLMSTKVHPGDRWACAQAAKSAKHVISPLSKQAQVYLAAMAHYFSTACLSFSPPCHLPAQLLN
ncbi:hypothetical protein Baya_10102 [Bagarius yarrelli]|uniref:Uncharacterized protein n=1 Tax=Bagarius yarrelli TaxID=175774 RepID=A0A556UEX7_BAGYA|nr:hypothetical protein Baya_10102 [Bagarius yarrelli]